MNLTWMVTRGSGLVAFAMLAASAIWGLLLSSGVLGRRVKVKSLTWVHEALSVAALLATGVHMIGLGLDEYVEFGFRELLLPGASGWRPTAVALGVIAFYGLFLITASFYVRRWIGQTLWRLLHYLSFGILLGALIHGIAYVGLMTAVVVLVIVRGAGEETRAAAPRQPARTAVHH